MSIVNVRGTSGSGKSTLAREVIAHYDCGVWFSPPGYTDLLKDVENHSFTPRGRMFVVGNYARPCGGCDTIKTQDEIVAAVRWGADTCGNVLFEGAVVSTIAERYLKLADDFRGSFIFAILDTPLDVCLERVRQRRLAKGNTKPLSTYSTEQKYNSVLRFKEKALAQGYHVITLDHTKPLPQLLEVLT